MANPPPPQQHAKGQRQALDARWLAYLAAGGDPGDAQQLAASPAFQTGVTEFNQAKFFEANESFERTWRDVPYPDRLLALALSKLGAAFTHAEHGNLTSAAKVVRDAQRCLAPLPLIYASLAVAPLREALATWIASPRPKQEVIVLAPAENGS